MNMHGLFKELHGRFNVDAECAQASTLVVDLVPDYNNVRKENMMRACHETRCWMKEMELVQKLFIRN